jgi:hypothetical protein
MPSPPKQLPFKEEFLKYYLAVGLGAMSKKDTDALVMYLLDQYGASDNQPLKGRSNQEVSFLLKVPVAKVKSLRYEAGLKYGDLRPEEKAMQRLLAALRTPSLDPKSDRIQLMIEDLFAKNWLQGELKRRGIMFNYTHNNEILEIKSEDLLEFLAEMFRENEFKDFRERLNELISDQRSEKRTKAVLELFKGVTKELLKAGVSAVTKVHGF